MLGKELLKLRASESTLNKQLAIQKALYTDLDQRFNLELNNR